MILNKWRGYEIKIFNRTPTYCKIELFHFNDQHFRVYSLNNKSLTDEEINNNIMSTIKINGYKNQ